LNAVHILGHRFVPFQPLIAALRDQAFAKVHITEELFPPVRAKALDKCLVIHPVHHGLAGSIEIAVVLLITVQLSLERFFLFFIRGLCELLLHFLLLYLVGVARILHVAHTGGSGIEIDTGGSIFFECPRLAVKLLAGIGFGFRPHTLVDIDACLGGPVEGLACHCLRKGGRPALAVPGAVFTLILLDFHHYLLQSESDHIISPAVGHLSLHL